MIRLIACSLALLASPVAAQRTPKPPPIIQVPQPAFEEYADWIVTRFGRGYVAYTKNKSDEAFGVICADVCSLYLNTGNTCTSGDRLPALGNSSGGSLSFDFRCAVIEGRHILVTDIPDIFIDAMEIGGELAIVTALKSVQFKVSRFSLVGALKAAGRVATLSEKPQPQSRAPEKPRT